MSSHQKFIAALPRLPSRSTRAVRLAVGWCARRARVAALPWAFLLRLWSASPATRLLALRFCLGGHEERSRWERLGVALLSVAAGKPSGFARGAGLSRLAEVGTAEELLERGANPGAALVPVGGRVSSPMHESARLGPASALAAMLARWPKGAALPLDGDGLTPMPFALRDGADAPRGALAAEQWEGRAIRGRMFCANPAWLARPEGPWSGAPRWLRRWLPAEGQSPHVAMLCGCEPRDAEGPLWLALLAGSDPWQEVGLGEHGAGYSARLVDYAVARFGLGGELDGWDAGLAGWCARALASVPLSERSARWREIRARASRLMALSDMAAREGRGVRAPREAAFGLAMAGARRRLRDRIERCPEAAAMEAAWAQAMDLELGLGPAPHAAASAPRRSARL